jgi:hypothetical protein
MRLLQILLDTYKEEYELNLREGLIKTVEKGKSQNIIRRAFPKWEVEDYASFDGEGERNDFSVTSPNSITKEEADKFLVLLNNLGWFVSFLRIYDKEGNKLYYSKFDKEVLDKYLRKDVIGSITFDCEPKFDTEVTKIPKVLYHVTPAKSWDKISKIGLVPRSRSKTSYHPERVYLSSTIEGIKRLTPQMYQVTGINSWVVIKVDTSMIPGDYFKLYKDSNFRPEGYYTMNNIPPGALEKKATMDFKF